VGYRILGPEQEQFIRPGIEVHCRRARVSRGKARVITAAIVTGVNGVSTDGGVIVMKWMASGNNGLVVEKGLERSLTAKRSERNVDVNHRKRRQDGGGGPAARLH
jgi:hypothetical protein